MSAPEINKTYLGDSVYATWDGYYIHLFTDNGMGKNMVDTIYLEPQVIDALIMFCNQLIKEKP